MDKLGGGQLTMRVAERRDEQESWYRKLETPATVLPLLGALKVNTRSDGKARSE